MSGGEAGGADGPDWQRLDKWLWCARFMKHRSDCAGLVAAGALRINRQPTDKAHARLRVGDVLTVAFGPAIRVIVVQALAARRGPPAEARLLYREVPETVCSANGAGGCEGGHSVAYRASAHPASPDTRSA